MSRPAVCVCMRICVCVCVCACVMSISSFVFQGLCLSHCTHRPPNMYGREMKERKNTIPTPPLPVSLSLRSSMTVPRRGGKLSYTGGCRGGHTSFAFSVCTRTCIMGRSACSSSWNGRILPYQLFYPESSALCGNTSCIALSSATSHKLLTLCQSLSFSLTPLGLMESSLTWPWYVYAGQVCGRPGPWLGLHLCLTKKLHPTLLIYCSILSSSGQ